MPKHPPFTSETGRAAAKLSRKIRGAQVRLQKSILSSQKAGRAVGIIGDTAKVFVATPVGQIITGFFIINMLEQNDLLVATDAAILKEALLGTELLGALGGTNLIPQVASLFTLGTSVPKVP